MIKIAKKPSNFGTNVAMLFHASFRPCSHSMASMSRSSSSPAVVPDLSISEAAYPLASQKEPIQGIFGVFASPVGLAAMGARLRILREEDVRAALDMGSCI